MILTTHPTCPYCGHVETDTSGIIFDLENDALVKCVRCKVTYLLIRNIRVSYSSDRIYPCLSV